MKLNDVRRFSAYVSTIYHSEYITKCQTKIILSYFVANKYDIFQTVRRSNKSEIEKDYNRRVKFDVNVSSSTGKFPTKALSFAKPKIPKILKCHHNFDPASQSSIWKTSV